MANFSSNISLKLPKRAKIMKLPLPQNCRKFCPPKIFVHQIFFRRNNLPTEIQHMSNWYKIHVQTFLSCKVYREIRNSWKIFVGQNCRNFKVLKILSAEKFCPPKFLSAKILFNKVLPLVWGGGYNSDELWNSIFLQCAHCGFWIPLVCKLMKNLYP